MLAWLLAATACSTPPTHRKAAWTNSLGMEFVEVPCGGKNLLFACLETQEAQLAAYGQQPGDGAARPAAQVSWTEAVAFCDWLTDKEQKAGLIGSNQRYRLPTDHEWSCAVGIGDLETAHESPEAKDGRIASRYPWGTQWPPPRGAGNLCGRESKSDFPDHFIAKYHDGLSGGQLASKASAANELGIYDLGGSLWEWCQDRFREGTDWRVLRGGSWKSNRPQTLLSSHRTHDPESYRSDSVGFRCVLDGSP